MAGFGGFLRGLELGVKMAGDISRRQYVDETREGQRALRENSYPGEDPKGLPTSPLDNGTEGPKVATVENDDLKTKVKPTTSKDTSKGDQISGEGGSGDTLVGSRGNDDLSAKKGGGGNFIDNVYNYYRGKGLSHAAAAGWAGNFMQESGGAEDVLRGERKGDGGASGYAGQWQGKRQRNLIAFAKSRGRSSPSLSDQLDFALEEGKADSPYRDDVWVNHAHKLDAAQSPQQATAIIRKFFERPSADDLGKRTRYAMMAGGGGGGFTDMAGGGGGVEGDDLIDDPAAPGLGGRALAAGVLPDPGGSDSSYGDEGGDQLASVATPIETPAVQFAAPQAFEIAGMDADWARPAREEDTLYAAEGGAIPDFTNGVPGTDGSGTDTSNKSGSFGWGAILGNTGLPQGGKPADVGLGGEGDFGKQGGFGNADYGAQGQPAGWFNRDTADAQAAQAGRLQRNRLSAVQAAGAANVLKNQQQAAIDEKARQAALAAAQAKAAAAAVKPVVKPVAKPVAKPAAKPVAAKPLVAKPNPVVMGGTSPIPMTKAVDPNAGLSLNIAQGVPLTRQATKFLQAYNEDNKAGRPHSQAMTDYGRAHGFLVDRKAGGLVNTRGFGGVPGSQAHYEEGGPVQMFEEGGAIPEPGAVASFAKGGDTGGLFGGYFKPRQRVERADRDEMFQKFLKEEQRKTGAGAGTENARDRAARRLSRLEGGPSSTAYAPGKGGGKAAPKAAPRSGGGGGAKTDPITTKSAPFEPGIGSGIPTPPPVDRIGSGIPTPAPADRIGSGIPTPPDPARIGSGIPTPDPLTRSPTSEPNSPPKPEIADPHTNVGAIPEPAVVVDPTVAPDPTLAPSRARPTSAQPAKDRSPLKPRVTTTQSPDPFGLGSEGSEKFRDPNAPVLPEPDPDPLWTARDEEYKRRATPQTGPTEPPPVVQPAVAAPTPSRARPTTPSPDKGLVPQAITPAVAPAAAAPAGGPDHSAFIANAMSQLESGRDPKEIGETLRMLGVPQDLWPLELQNAALGFAKGGAIPDSDEGGGGGSMFAGLDVEAAGHGKTVPLQATPKLRNDIAKATHSGLQFLKQEFGLAGEGAVPTPDDSAIRSQGARRMASGEGAADDDEVANLDRQFDPQGQLTGNDREIHRLAATHAWFLEHGHADKAAAVAASLMQYGAQRTAQIGGLAAGAYSKYQQTGDPKDLDAVAGLLEKAYEMIPNGSSIQIAVGPDGSSLQAEKTDADGNTEMVDIAPREIEGYLQAAMNGSGYWGEIAKMADPKGYQSRLDEGRQVREGQRDEGRQIREGDRDEGRSGRQAKLTADLNRGNFDYEYKIKRGDTLEDAETEDRRKKEAETRAAGIADKAALRDAAIEIAKNKNKLPEDKLNQVLFDDNVDKAMAAREIYNADQTPENKAIMDAFVGEAYRNSGHDASKLTELGFTIDEETNLAAEAPPYPGFTKQLNAKDKKTYWVSPDGSQMVLAAGS